MEGLAHAVPAEVGKACSIMEMIVEGCFLDNGVLGQCGGGIRWRPAWNGCGDLKFVETRVQVGVVWWLLRKIVGLGGL